MTSVNRQEKGQSLVEFALLLPVFLLILVGIAEFGRGWMMKNSLAGAAREGARVAAVQSNFKDSQDWGDNVARTFLAAAGIVPDKLDVTKVPLTGVYTLPSIQVYIEYRYPVFIMNFIPGLPDKITVIETATMRLERYGYE